MFCLSSDLAKNARIMNSDILQMINDCCNASMTTDEDILKCYTFYTDGGAYSDSNTYFLFRLQGDGNTLHSTVKIPDDELAKKGVNIQVYMGREAEYDLNTMHPSKYKVNPSVNR